MIPIKSVYQLNSAVSTLNCQVKVLQAAAGATGAAQVFAQPAPSTTWSIVHSFANPPKVTVVDNSGNLVYADVLYVDATHVTITCNPAISGTAYLS